MDETMTVEQACEILNEVKWRGRDDWHVGPDALANTSRADYLRNVSSHTSRVNYALDDAIAIATSVVAQRELAALRKAASLVVETCHADSMGYLDKLRHLLAAYEQKEAAND